MTGKSTPCFWQLGTSPSYWQKPVSMSRNWEDPFISRSPHPELLGVNISTKPWNQSLCLWVLSLLAPRVHPQSLLFLQDDLLYKLKPREPGSQTNLKSTLENKRRLCTYSPQVLGSFRRVSGTFQIFSDVSHHNTWLGWYWLETSLQLSCIPKKLFYYKGNPLPKDPCA